MEVHDETRVPEFLKMLEELQSYHIEVGILGSGKGGATHKEGGITVLGIAIIHEFGSPKAGIPERSFIRAGLTAKEREIEREGAKLLEDVMALKLDPYSFMEALGENTVGKLQEYLTEMTTPSLKPATIEAKGSSGVLIDTGQLRDSIEFKVVRN